MLVVASANGRVGIVEAMSVLRRGRTALDAVEAGVRAVESNPDDHSVGLGGLPNMLGEVELDASIMDGRTLAAGAVGALKGYEHAISVARKVMEELPHVFLVGEGAERFAAEMGFPRVELLTEAARRIWADRLAGYGVDPNRLRYLEEMRERVRMTADPEKAAETVNFIARDASGNLATAVSTSGWAWKYPGRLGDSPVIGAGGYADSRYGAAACTGRGEIAIRLSTARSVVLYLKQGLALEDACREAMREVAELPDPYHTAFAIVAADASGRHAAVSNERTSSYIYMTDATPEPVEAERVHA